MTELKFEHARIIGDKLRTARKRHRITLRELARKADISASMLSQIETGKAYPSVRSIYDIARALDLPVDYFFPDQLVDPLAPANESVEAAGELIYAGTLQAQVLHASDRPTIMLRGGVTWTRLTASAEANAEFLEITYACGATSGEDLSQHEGREFGFILEGELVVQLCQEEFILSEGDSIIFDSTTPHLLTNKSSQPMRALWLLLQHTG